MSPLERRTSTLGSPQEKNRPTQRSQVSEKKQARLANTGIALMLIGVAMTIVGIYSPLFGLPVDPWNRLFIVSAGFVAAGMLCVAVHVLRLLKQNR